MQLPLTLASTTSLTLQPCFRFSVVCPDVLCSPSPCAAGARSTIAVLQLQPGRPTQAPSLPPSRGSGRRARLHSLALSRLVEGGLVGWAGCYLFSHSRVHWSSDVCCICPSLSSLFPSVSLLPPMHALTHAGVKICGAAGYLFVFNPLGHTSPLSRHWTMLASRCGNSLMHKR